MFRALNAESKPAESKQPQKPSKTDAALSATMESMASTHNDSLSTKSASPDENNHYSEGCLTQPSRPTRDWSKVYREIESVGTAQEYHRFFDVRSQTWHSNTA